MPALVRARAARGGARVGGVRAHLLRRRSATRPTTARGARRARQLPAVVGVALEPDARPVLALVPPDRPAVGVAEAVTRPGMPDGHAPLLDLPRAATRRPLRVGKPRPSTRSSSAAAPIAGATTRGRAPSRAARRRRGSRDDAAPHRAVGQPRLRGGGGGRRRGRRRAEAAVHAAAHGCADVMTRARANADADLRAWHAQTRVQTVHDAPHARIVPNFVTAAEAKALVARGPPFHRSSTARESPRASARRTRRRCRCRRRSCARRGGGSR